LTGADPGRERTIAVRSRGGAQKVVGDDSSEWIIDPAKKIRGASPARSMRARLVRYN